MTLYQNFTQTGNYFFRYRSYIPLLFYPLAILIIYLERNSLTLYNEITWSVVCFIVSLSGLYVRILVTGYVPDGTSGRNTKEQKADTLNTRGIYSIVRHPLYLGNFLMWFGLILYTEHIWFIIVTTLLFWLYYERIMFAEEQFIQSKFGEAYKKWAEKTPAFLPRLSSWKKPELNFSVKKVIRREYRGLYAVIISFALLNLLMNLADKKEFMLSEFWLIVFITGTLLFIVVRILQKTTNILKIQRRINQS
jgi:protein-S-isoprenylcysteine O-methyltransferase Ste14